MHVKDHFPNNVAKRILTICKNNENSARLDFHLKVNLKWSFNAGGFNNNMIIVLHMDIGIKQLNTARWRLTTYLFNVFIQIVGNCVAGKIVYQFLWLKLKNIVGDDDKTEKILNRRKSFPRVSLHFSGMSQHEPTVLFLFVLHNDGN